LNAHDPQLMQLGALAERYFRDDPGTAIFKLRQFAELLSKMVAARHALYLGERETFDCCGSPQSPAAWRLLTTAPRERLIHA
jgi:hypothetical protein